LYIGWEEECRGYASLRSGGRRVGRLKPEAMREEMQRCVKIVFTIIVIQNREAFMICIL
jgi:hypothetical protein